MESQVDPKNWTAEADECNHETKHKHLLSVIANVLKFHDIKALRAVEGYWSKDLDTLHLNYFHHGPLDDDLLDAINDLGAEILCQYHSEMIYDQPIRLDYERELPSSDNMVFPQQPEMTKK